MSSSVDSRIGKRVDEVALFQLITSDRLDEDIWQRTKALYTDRDFVAAWYEGSPVYCQRVKSPLDVSHMAAEAQIELKKAGAFTDLSTIDDVLKMPCLNTTRA